RRLLRSTKKGVEHKQSPQRRAIVSEPGYMCIVEMPQISRFEHASRGEAVAGYDVANTRRKRPSEPASERHREAHLRAIKHLPRQHRLHRLLEQILALPVLHYEAARQSSHPLYQRVIHQRLSHLERMRHTGAIDFRIDITYEVRL